VLAMVQARLEKLDPAARRVLRAASTFGETFWRAGVEALVGGDDTAAWLSVLVDHGVIAVKDEERGPGAAGYRFHHPLTLEAAREMLPRDDPGTGRQSAEPWSRP
jgi:predicted ATPase